MIILTLDEYGLFEEKTSQAVFIAGIMYDDAGDPTDMKDEEIRIADYYNRVITAAKNRYIRETREKEIEPDKNIVNLFIYPSALHAQVGGMNNKEQMTVLKYVKTEIGQTLPEFIKDCQFHGKTIVQAFGDKKEEGRKGCYTVFVMVKGRNGMERLGSDADKMIKDDFASNLYFHMASRAVNRLIFHNPLYDEMPSLKLDIASRSSSSADTMDKKKSDQYHDLGYERRASKINPNFHYYSLMNADIYRTLIAEEMLRSNKNIKVTSFSVKPMTYVKGGSDMFLFLADSICSYIGFELKLNNESSIFEVYDKVIKITQKDQNLVFIYDEIDNYFMDAWGAYEEGRIFDALSLVYDAGQIAGEYAEFYKNRVFKYVENAIAALTDPKIFEKAVIDISESIFTNNLSSEKLWYIYSVLEKMTEKGDCLYTQEDKKAGVLVRLWETGMAAASHTGNSEQALSYYDLCRSLFGYTGIDCILRLNNRLVVLLEDLFDWEAAEIRAKENVAYIERFMSIINEISPYNINNLRTIYGKSISQYARTLASRRSHEAEPEFRKALEMFEKGTADYKITQSYLLHHYLDMGMYDEYEKEAIDYFNGYGNLDERLDYLLTLSEESNAIISKRYAFYVFFRGLFLMCQRDGLVPEALWQKINSMKFKTRKDGKAHEILTIGHPWELIYKYLIMLAVLKSDREYEEKYQQHLEGCMSVCEKTITSVMMFGNIEILNLKKEKDCRDNESKKLCQYLKTHFNTFEGKSFNDNGDERFKELAQIFSFMYR